MDSRACFVSRSICRALPTKCATALEEHIQTVAQHGTDAALDTVDTALELVAAWRSAASVVSLVLLRRKLQYVVVQRIASAAVPGVEYQDSTLVAYEGAGASSSAADSLLAAAMAEMHRVSIALEDLFVEYASNIAVNVHYGGKCSRAVVDCNRSDGDGDSSPVVLERRESSRKRARAFQSAFHGAAHYTRTARVIAFSRDGRVFELFEVESLAAAVRRVYAATDGSVSVDCTSTQHRRVYCILKTADGSCGKVYTHPLRAGEADDNATVRYMIQYSADAAPADAADAWMYWCEWSAKQVGTSARKGASRLLGHEAMWSKRAARVIAFSRDGRVFNLFEEASLMEAARRVYAATDDSVSIVGNCQQYSRIHSVLATVRGVGGKVYTHPLRTGEAENDAAVRYMIQYSADAAPEDAADAWDFWCEWSRKQFATSRRIGSSRMLGHEPLRGKRAARVIAFARDSHVFDVFEAESLVKAVQRVYDSTIMSTRSLQYRRIKRILHTADGSGGKVYTHPLPEGEADDDAAVRYMIQYSSDAAPADAADAQEYWREWRGKQVDTSQRKGASRLLGHEALKGKLAARVIASLGMAASSRKRQRAAMIDFV